MKELWEAKSGLIVKLIVNQFAFSLFGLFVSSPFLNNDTLCVVAGVFAWLFYLAVVAFAVLDDAQKDHIATAAGRAKHTVTRGAAYLALSFAPSAVISVLHAILSLAGANGIVKTVLYFLNRFAFGGEVLGIDVGLARFTFDEALGERVSNAPMIYQQMSIHGLFQLLFILISFAVLFVIYALAFGGYISYNTTDKSKKNA